MAIDAGVATGELVLPTSVAGPSPRSPTAAPPYVEVFDLGGLRFGLPVVPAMHAGFQGPELDAQRYPAEPVSGCHAGGVAGREVSYAESTGLMLGAGGQVRWSPGWDAGGTVGAGPNAIRFAAPTAGGALRWTSAATPTYAGDASPIDPAPRVNTLFGFTRPTPREPFAVTTWDSLMNLRSIAGTTRASSGTLRDATGRIEAGDTGVWFRQVSRREQRVPVLAHDLCGEAQDVGVATFADWRFEVALARGSSCDPVPSSPLPAPECITECIPMSDFAP